MTSTRSLLVPRRVRRAGRRLWRTVRPQRAAVVYHPRYDADLPGVPNDPLRAERILAFLAAEGLVLRRSVIQPRPASVRDLAAVHTADYLDAVKRPETLERIFGLGIAAHQVDRLLDLQRIHVGGTDRAVRLALEGRSPALNLGGGLHHAHADHGQGFCIFNDVAVAIHAARRRGFAGRTLVIDLDLHDGDGTRALFADDTEVHTFSIHARDWGDTEAEASTCIALGDEVDDGLYLETLRRRLPPVIEEFRPDLVIYLAGTDPAADDRLGGWQLSARGLLARDRFVVAQTRSRGTSRPLAVLLAGGYGTETWRYSARFASTLLHGGRAVEPPSTEVMSLRRYRWLSSLLDPAELSGAQPDNPFGLTEDDLFLPAWGMTRETRFLGFYTKHGLELTIERAGLFDRLRDLGFEHPVLALELDDPSVHALRVFAEPERRRLLMEIRTRRDRRTVPDLELLAVDWLLLQNPDLPFSANRRPLPGQEHPGLGMADDVVGLLLAACRRLHLDGLTWVPSHFHTAGPWHDRFIVIDPEAGDQLQALERLLRDVPLDVATRAVADGDIRWAESGERFRWKPSPVLLPYSPAAKQWADAQRRARAERPLPRLVRRTGGSG